MHQQEDSANSDDSEEGDEETSGDDGELCLCSV